MKTAAEWLTEMKARPCVTENDLLVVLKAIKHEAYQQACADAAARLEPFRTQGDWKDVDVFQADILALRDSKKPEMF